MHLNVGEHDIPIDEPLLGVSKLTQLVSDHILGNSNRNVVFTVVHHETNAASESARHRAPGRVLSYPTKFGRIVHDRACVLIGTLSSNALVRFGNATKYGPTTYGKLAV